MHDDEFTAHCTELLSPLGAVRTRRMFGGRGLYLDELFVALIADEQLYLKTDVESRPRFEAAGCEPFRYLKQGEWTTLGYYRPPEEAMESPALMRPWARLALEAALRAQALKLKPRPARKEKARTNATARSGSPRR
ncbi:TfoX/Sxy family protein [Roseateles sp. DAIF2]|uniref:TfoX/Sxy family protein n=1 Tax=Roseateles sp. DAIF2 TaxID=2714952 RepID=UPI0018A26DD1|nr:TfoX/Sxy family protein [Roseateles sp. DAIF2]QPF72320.1 TfoX/Sxy family protein [Roseateles sp. DAIF2]